MLTDTAGITVRIGNRNSLADAIAGKGPHFRLPPKLFNSAQTSEHHEITKRIALKRAQESRNPQFTRAKVNYENQYERQD
jgi:hypothetical protein